MRIVVTIGAERVGREKKVAACPDTGRDHGTTCVMTAEIYPHTRGNNF